jgi:hypothetical protein
MSESEEIDRLYKRLSVLDSGPVRPRTKEEQKEVRTILKRLRQLYVTHPYLFED